MTTVVVQAHPFEESYNTAMLEAAIEGLRAAGVDPKVVRLNQGAKLDASTVESALSCLDT